MKVINVYLRGGSHTVYRDLVEFPPSNVSYQSSSLKAPVGDNLVVRKIRNYILRKYTKLKPPAMFIKNDNSDLIHSCSGKMILNKKPWVVDVEHVGAFANFHVEKLHNKKHRERILKLLSSEYCKKILPWSFAGKKSIENCFGYNWLKDKMEVVYPAIKVRPFKKFKDGKKVRLLFVGYRFFQKGGKQVLDAFKVLDKKFDVELTIISNVPEEIKNSFKNTNNVHFLLPKFSIEELIRNFYSNGDIFVFPTYIDSFGMIFLEAMSCELPIISTDVFATPEIVEDGKNGFLIHSLISCYEENYLHKWISNKRNWEYFVSLIKLDHPKIVDQLVKKTSILIENGSLRRKMGLHGRKMVESEKFSIKERNKKLRNIYEEALQ